MSLRISGCDIGGESFIRVNDGRKQPTYDILLCSLYDLDSVLGHGVWFQWLSAEWSRRWADGQMRWHTMNVQALRVELEIASCEFDHTAISVRRSPLIHRFMTKSDSIAITTICTWSINSSVTSHEPSETMASPTGNRLRARPAGPRVPVVSAGRHN